MSKSCDKIYRTAKGVRVRIHPSNSLEKYYSNLGVKVNRVKDGYGFYVDAKELMLSK